MAITVAVLTEGESPTDASSYATASISPTTDKLALLAVESRIPSGTPNTPTATGAGLTFTTIAFEDFGGTDNAKLTLLRALGTTSTGAITIDFAGQTQSWCQWAVVEFTDMDTSGVNGAGAIVQSKTNNVDPGTSLTITMDSVPDSANAMFATFRTIDIIAGHTPGSGWTELTEQTGAAANGYEGPGTNTVHQTQWRNSGDQTADASWSGSHSSNGIAVEIKLAASDLPPGLGPSVGMSEPLQAQGSGALARY